MTGDRPPRSAYRRFLAIPTRWMDNDSYGHVNNVTYYSYFDTVVNEHLIRDGGLDIVDAPQIGLVVGSIVSKDIRKFAGLASLGTQLLFLKFSRSDEYQADSLGIRYARQARYSPGEMLRFFTALENMSAESTSHRIPTFLSTHPMTGDRIARVKEMVSSQDVRLEVKKEPYLNQVDGMVFGENPRQGFVENGVFYHPEMCCGGSRANH